MITRALILLNVLAYIWEIVIAGPGMFSLMGGGNDERVLQLGALSPASVLVGHQWWRILTSAFLHEGLAHIGLNMLSLWIIGRFVENVAGPVRMTVIYFASLVASGLGVIYLSPAANATTGTVGASGAIFGLFGAFFAIGLKLGPPGMQLVRANLGILIINLIFTFTFPGISWEAHIAGLAAGFLLTLLIYAPPRRVAPVVVDANTGDRYDTEYQTPEPPR